MAKKKPKTKGKQVTKPSAVDELSTDGSTATYNRGTPPIMPVFLKVCRLCENKDGPFLNIFDSDKVTAKKIDELMPFSVLENDDLPHKICFRCSAKLEELYEFIQKCIKTQHSLNKAMGKDSAFIEKTKMSKKLWEEKLNKSNMSNDDICDAVIKKAMEGIKGIPLNLPEDVPPQRTTRSKETTASKREIKEEPKSEESDDVPLKQMKLSIEKHETKLTQNKATRSKNETVPTKTENIEKKTTSQGKKGESAQSKNSQSKKKSQTSLLKPLEDSSSISKETSHQKVKNPSMNNFSLDYDDPPSPAKVSEESDVEVEKEDEPQKEEPKKPFNIMDHISMIKVNGVGLLFQCKLCNRNFLKKEVVESHNCAKNGIPTSVPKVIPAPEPPKVPTVKYITIDGDMKKTLTEKVKMGEKSESLLKSSIAESNKEEVDNEPPKIKPKPGPASKTKRKIDFDSPASQVTSVSTNLTAATSSMATVLPLAVPQVQFPLLPNLNGRFKLVPGPNNTFTLVEDSTAPTNEPIQPNITEPTEIKKRKLNEKNNLNSEVIDLEDQSKPYPVGLFQTIDRSSTLYNPINPSVEAPATFTTPAMKKQSYTVVQTGNPSKLLISTKTKVELDASKKRQKKAKHEHREEEGKQPFKVTIEDAAPPKDTGFFTFINVDPLLQPSYVLPTDNIIQESQISTSSSVLRNQTKSQDSKGIYYNCNLCGDKFSREKKLLTHIQSHYNKMDEEDLHRSEKNSKKKGRK